MLKATPQQFATFTSSDSATKTSSVNFPCALVSSNDSFSLDESSTLFFVIKPEYPGKDERV
jgi:hypothetical protein